MMLAKAGWWAGDPERILRAPARRVLQAIQYMGYANDYESTVIEINREADR